MKITYNFVNGESVEIEVNDDIGGIILEEDRCEYNNEHTETRRHISIEMFNDKSPELSDEKNMEYIMIGNLTLDADAMSAEIDGKEVYANVLEYETVPWHETTYEAHENYTDIQYIISGSEAMTYAEKSTLIVKEPYSPEKDIAFYTNDIRGIDFPTNAGWYCIFLPQDAHKPKPMNGVPVHVKKVVVKVKMK